MSFSMKYGVSLVLNADSLLEAIEKAKKGEGKPVSAYEYEEEEKK